MTMWAIKFDNGEWSHIDIGYLSYTRSGAWAKWAEDHTFENGNLDPKAKRDRRKGLYRAVRVNITEAPPIK